MDPAADPPEPSRWPWILWSLTTLALFSIAGMLGFFARALATLYDQFEMKSLPLTAELILKGRDGLWLLALAAAVSGIPFARKRDAEKTQRWALVLLLLMIAAGAGIGVALLAPIIRIQTTLSK